MLRILSRPAPFLVFGSLGLAALLMVACRPVSPPSPSTESEDAAEARDRTGSPEPEEAAESAESAEPADDRGEVAEISETVENTPGAESPGEEAADKSDVSAGEPGEPSDPKYEAAGSVVLRFDQTASHGNLSLRLLELDDSRCPIGVQCVWEGQVAVTIEVGSEPGSDDAPSPEIVELILRAGHETASAVAAGHELRLLGAAPHPREGVTPERAARSVTVEVRPL